MLGSLFMRERYHKIAGGYDSDDREYWQLSIYVRKQLGAAFEIFVDHFAGKSCRIDFQHHEVCPAFEYPIQRYRHLMRIRTVDEPLRCERCRHVFAGTPGCCCFSFGRDVKETLVHLPITDLFGSLVY